jgi:hypothetical protein
VNVQIGRPSIAKQPRDHGFEVLSIDQSAPDHHAVGIEALGPGRAGTHYEERAAGLQVI